MASKREIEVYIQLYPMPEPGSGYTYATLVTTGKRYKVNLDYIDGSIVEAYIKGLLSVTSQLDKSTMIKFHCDSVEFMGQLLQISTLGIGEGIGEYIKYPYRRGWEALLISLTDHKLCLSAQHNGHFEGIAYSEALRFAKELEELSRPNIMDFATEQEALELAALNGWKVIDLIIRGSVATLYYKPTKVAPTAELKEARYIVCTTTPNSPMYVSKDGRYTFNQSEAKRMSLGEAKSKAVGMTRASRRGYRWNALKF